MRLIIIGRSDVILNGKFNSCRDFIFLLKYASWYGQNDIDYILRYNSFAIGLIFDTNKDTFCYC